MNNKSTILTLVILIFLGVTFLLIRARKFFLPLTPSDSTINTTPPRVQKENDLLLYTIIAENLDTPWAIAFLPDGSMLVTERLGTVRRIDTQGNLDPNPVATIEKVKEIGEGGLMGITLHPNFSINNYVYLYTSHAKSGLL